MFKLIIKGIKVLILLVSHVMDSQSTAYQYN